MYGEGKGEGKCGELLGETRREEVGLGGRMGKRGKSKVGKREMGKVSG